jgi:hypothetical protein
MNGKIYVKNPNKVEFSRQNFVLSERMAPKLTIFIF